MNWLWLPILTFIIHNSEGETFKPCSEISRELRFPCRCALGPVEAELYDNPSLSIDCDGIVFPGDFPFLPYGIPVISFSQRWVGYQALPIQLFSSGGLPLRILDLSGNSLRRLTEKGFHGLQSTLIELKLGDNLLGDTLNPIFSSNEFRDLNHLQILDLGGNGIKAIEEGIFEGCVNLKELYLDRNSFISIPSSSLNGPKSLKTLSLRNNRIVAMKQNAFLAQPNLEHIDLSHNLITTIEGGSLNDLEKLQSLRLSHNTLARFNSDVFEGAENLQLLDLSQNFVAEFPTVALRVFKNLRYLNLSSNLIQNLDNSNFLSLTGLYHLDLSRNSIANVVPGTFLGLKHLRRLDIAVNSLRTIEDDAFEGLDNLERLNLKDNNILLIPASALGRLPRLRSLQLDYNRITALSGDILQSIAERVTELVLARNVVRELPTASFQLFKQLEHLDLTRNLLITLTTDAFLGLESTLKTLTVAQNHITNLAGPPTVLSKLERLDLSENNLAEISRKNFFVLPNLKHFNLSHNSRLTKLSPIVMQQLPSLSVVDLRHINMKLLPRELFQKSSKLEQIYLAHNSITEIQDGVFSNMPNLSVVDLSHNHINNIRQGAFVNVMNIRKLSLKGNHLASFKGEFFNTGTSLEDLDISDNQVSYLFPSSFRIHPRLKKIIASGNKLNFFPAELITNLQFLEHIDLANNGLKTVEELDFARLPRLNTLILRQNQLELVSEMAFLNSSQLQVIDLGHNNLERLGERTFEGLTRIKSLNLEANSLNDLPETIFERTKLHMLENINLAGNDFQIAPFKALQKQYFFVTSVDLSRNKLKELATDDSIMVNIKKLDLSFNPLSDGAIRSILGEPKVVRELNMAGTGITEVVQFETPFLHYLNLSHNNITELNDRVFERTTLLETLDIANNQITDLSNFSKIWPRLKNLQTLNISKNPILTISQNDLEGLQALRHLSLHSLEDCEKIEKSAFKSVPNLAVLEAYDYPKLGYLDVQGLLQNTPALERIDLETKDSAIGSDQLQSVLHPRLKELGLRGSRLRSISSGTLSGIKGPQVCINIRNTSLTSLPQGLFFSVPRSSRIVLDVTGSKLSTLSPSLLTTIDDRRGYVKIIGLETNPIVCDCGARALRRWLPAHMTTVRCSGPSHLKNRLLVEIGDDELTCDARKITTSTSVTSTTVKISTVQHRPKSTEPEIIWSVPATEETLSTGKSKILLGTASTGQSTISNDDTLIIGIVGGVVAFIAILIIIICIIRLRMSSNQYANSRGPGTVPCGVPQSVMGHPNFTTGTTNGSNCACSVKGSPATVNPTLYSLPPQYSPGYNSSTLPHKMTGGSQQNVSAASIRPSNYSTMGRIPYYHHQNTNAQPYFIAYSPEEKIYR